MNKKIKIVALVHNAIPHERMFLDKPLAKYFFNKCDGFITLSDFVKKDIIRLKNNAKILHRSHPIYDHYEERISKEEARSRLNSIDHSFDISITKKTILFFGLIRDYKGLDILIEATKDFDNSYQLIIAGECYGNFSKYAKLIDESPIKENIHLFAHYIPEELICPLFSASDVLVLPYRAATQSGVIALAYQFELPVIVTDVGALGETVRAAKTGIVVASANPKLMAKGVKDYFEHDPMEFKANILSKKNDFRGQLLPKQLQASCKKYIQKAFKLRSILDAA